MPNTPLLIIRHYNRMEPLSGTVRPWSAPKSFPRYAATQRCCSPGPRLSSSLSSSWCLHRHRPTLELDTSTIISRSRPLPPTLRTPGSSTRSLCECAIILYSTMPLIQSLSTFDYAGSFESHFTEIKYGLISGEAGTTDNALRWDVNSATQWNTSLVAGTWYNL